jgi:hypothetical protein
LTLAGKSSVAASAATATMTADSGTADTGPAFNPFSEVPASSMGRREVIKNPTLEQVLEPGPHHSAVRFYDLPILPQVPG